MKKELLVVSLGLFLLFSFVQMHFLSYYNVFGIPFGKVDVDAYMGAINKDEISIDHVLITLIPSALSSIIDPGLLYTVTIPFLACIILPLTLFFFAYYFSRDYTTAFFSVFIMLFGTFTLHVYLITALWAQMLATIFALWSIIFIEHYYRTNNRAVIFVAVIFSILTILSHPAGFAMVFIYIGLKIYNDISRKSLFILCIIPLVGLSVYILDTFTVMFGDYIYVISLDYVFMYFVHPVFWIMAGISAIFLLHTEQKQLVFMSFIVGVVSPAFVLWRPLISILPLVAYFSAIVLSKYTIVYNYPKFKNIILPILACLFIVLCVVFVSSNTTMFMNAMLWEMEAEPGILDVFPRSINSSIMRDMYFGGQHVCFVNENPNNNITLERCY